MYKTILHNNNYPTSILPKKHIPNNVKHHPVRKGISHLSYFGKDTRIVTILLKDIDIRTFFKTTNTIKRQLKQKNPLTDTFEESEIYQLK
jgi:hypothetical protein